MPGRFAMFVTGFIIALAVIYLPDSQIVSGQSANAPTRFAAVPGEKGGQDIFGAYDVVADWPKDLSTIKGHEGWTFGAGQSVFAESPNRIFVLQRGELPHSVVQRHAPYAARARPRVSDRTPAVARRDDGEPARKWRHRPARRRRHAGVGERRRRHKFGVDARWEHSIMIFDGQGNLIDSWNQYRLDAAAAALRRDQPLRSAEACLDR